MNTKPIAPLEKNQDQDQEQEQKITTNPSLSSSKSGKNYQLIIGMLIGVVLTTIATTFINRSPNSEGVEAPAGEVTATTTKTTSTVKQAITTTIARNVNVESKIDATGTVLAYELIPVTSQGNSLQIEAVLADEGDFVNQGDILVRLDDSVLQAELEQAQAGVKQAQARLAELKAGTRIEEVARAKENLNVIRSEITQAEADLSLAQAKLRRNRQLETEGAIARDSLDEFINDELVAQSNLTRNKARLREAEQRLQELEKGARKEVIAQAEARLIETQASVKLINTRLEDTIVTAPVSGQIAQRNARVGDVASPSNSNQLSTIIQDGRLELEVRVPESELRNITSGQRVNISSTANPDLNLIGIVRDLNPIIDRDTRQGIINVDLPADSGLKPGMFVQTEIITDTARNLTVPIKAVIPQRNGEGLVYLIKGDNTVEAKRVTLGEIINNEAIEIRAGLNSGDEIALKGVDYLQDGVAVEIVQN